MFFDFFTDSAVLTLKLFEYIALINQLYVLVVIRIQNLKNFKSNI